MVRIGLGIYREKNKLGMVTVRKTIKGVSIENSRTVVIQDSNNSSAHPGEGIESAVREFLDFYKIKPGFVVFGLERDKILWNIVDTPPISKSELHQVLAYELELHVPTDPESLYFDAMQESDSTSAVAKALLITTPRPVVDGIMNTMKGLGLRLNCIEPAAVARWRLARQITNETDPPPFRVILSFSGDSAEILILKKGFPVLDRRIEMNRPGSLRDSEQSSESITEQISFRDRFADYVIQELKLSHISLGGSGSEDEIGEVWVMGDDAGSWIQALNDHAGELVFEKIPANTDEMDMLSSSVEQTALGLITAMGEETEACINLVPEAFRPIQRHTGLVITGILSGLLLSTLFLGGLNNFWRMELKLARTKAQIATMEKDVNRILEVNEQFNNIKKQFEFFRSLNQDYPSMLEILRELTEILPAEDTETAKKVWLNSFVSREHVLTIKGESESPEELITILENSPYFEKVHFEGAVSGKKFTIKMDVSKYQMQEETSPPEQTAANEKPAGPSGTPTSVPSGKTGSEESQTGETFENVNDESIPRGPAFPRHPRHSMENVPVEPEEPSAGETDLQPDEGNQPELVPPGETDEEAVERMKQNLFDFIQKHREEGNVVDRDRSVPEEQDPDEAAANFLEFLKAAAEERQNQEQGQE